MHATWGDATGYLRTSTREPPRAERTATLRQAAAVEAAARWLAAIERGGQVYVKEGGQSDFTLAVLGEVELHRQGAAGCVHLVQHSQWNEQTTVSRARHATRRAQRAHARLACSCVLMPPLHAPGHRAPASSTRCVREASTTWVTPRAAAALSQTATVRCSGCGALTRRSVTLTS